MRPLLASHPAFAHGQSEVASKQAEVDELTSQISEHESRSQGDGAAARREEYQRLEKAVGALRRNKKNLQEDLEISSMDPKQACPPRSFSSASFVRGRCDLPGKGVMRGKSSTRWGSQEGIDVGRAPTVDHGVLEPILTLTLWDGRC